MTSHEQAGPERRPALAAIFVPEPASGWGFRGDPYVWRALAARLATVERPSAFADAVEVMMTTFCELVGVGLDDEPALESVFRPQFDGGGMSGGRVSLRAWRDTLLPLLEQRLSATLDD